MIGRCTFLTLTFFLMTSCSDFSEQETQSSTPSSTSELKLANYGLSLVKNNATSFLESAQKFQKSLVEFCSSDIPNKTIKNSLANKRFEELLRSYYELHGFAIANLQPTETTSPLTELHYRTLNRCFVDVQVLNTKNKQNNLETMHVSVKGLNAIEYLLYDTELKSQCNIKKHPEIAIWNSLPSTEKKADRCEHALFLTDNLVKKAEEISSSWNPKNPEYEKNLNLSEFTVSEKNMIKNMVRALSMLEEIKDEDLGKPLGLNSLCTNDTDNKCVDAVQHTYSGLSLMAIVSSLESFKKIFNGENIEDFSMNDYLEEKGQMQIGIKMNRAINDAIETAEKIANQQTFLSAVQNLNVQACRETTLENPQEPICLLFKKVELITDIYKSDLLTYMSLEIQTSIPQGDND
jgi:uncharacterized protein